MLVKKVMEKQVDNEAKLRRTLGVLLEALAVGAEARPERRTLALGAFQLRVPHEPVTSAARSLRHFAVADAVARPVQVVRQAGALHLAGRGVLDELVAFGARLDERPLTSRSTRRQRGNEHH